MDTDKLIWTPAAPFILTDVAGVFFGSVRPDRAVPSLWVGTALLGLEVAKLPVRCLLPGECLGANLVDYPVTSGVCQYHTSKEAAMQFVIDTLAKQKSSK